jgi:hypothetical protein
MLTNIHRAESFPFQCFFVGQPQFRARLEQPDMEQFRQRVLASYHIESLDVAEVRNYVEHRLDVAGWQGRPELDPALYPRVHAMTGGVPRRINMVLNRLLLLGALEEREHIDAADLETVLDDLRGEVVGIEPTMRPATAPAPGADVTPAQLQALQDRIATLEALLLEVVETTTRLLAAPRATKGDDEPGKGPAAVPIRPVDRRG